MKPDERNISGRSADGCRPVNFDKRFAQDVRTGLGKYPKSLPCLYFYDRIGSILFERICRQPEYYCTRAEAEILKTRSRDIAAICNRSSRIVELGSGNSEKTRILLETFIDSDIRATYFPIDISRKVLEESAAVLKEACPPLNVRPIAARYEDGLDMLEPVDGRILLLWLGSSIGNYEPESAKSFIARLQGRLSVGDYFLIGVDLIKDSMVLESAYNDRSGATADFNLNLLARINRELGGHFLLERFEHRAVYNSEEGRIEMYLVSNCEQEVRIDALNTTVVFAEEERIHTENSYKYDPEEISLLGGHNGLRLIKQWFDSRKLFSLNLFEVSNGGS